ncbi:Holliday junction resolvase RuvX [Kiritimatiellaeota bacterium B1221]|nr:Holliday junction resolvase RuvX [Kiritimatiellaeota bacterium B1221]
MSAVGRVLGIDYGEVRIGLALSDMMRMVATPLETVEGKSQKLATRRIRGILEEKKIQTVVVGLPLHMNGDFGDLAQAATDFGEKLKAQVPGLEIVMWDERMSSAEAERGMRLSNTKAKRKKELRDQLAAQIILQSWLDAQGMLSDL